MNMQISAPATGLPVNAAIALAVADEPIARLIKAYQDGMQAFRASPDNLDDKSFAELAAKTWQPPLDELIEHTPEIQTIQGAIEALRLVREEQHFFEDSGAVKSLVAAVLRFLESAASPAPSHPDAELLELDRQIEMLCPKIDLNCEQDRLLTAAVNAVYDDVPPALTITAKDKAWFGLSAQPGDVWNQVIAEKVEAPSNLVYYMPLSKIKEVEARAAELRQAAKEHAARYEAYEIECGAKANEDEFNALSSQLDDLQKQAMALQPRTVGGFIVQAKIVKRMNTYWEEPAEKLDIGEREIFGFVNNVLALAGGVQ